jgi:hypothetical protein
VSGSYSPGGVGTTRLFARYLGHQTNLDVVAVAVVASILTGGFVVLRLEVVPHDDMLVLVTKRLGGPGQLMSLHGLLRGP